MPDNDVLMDLLGRPEIRTIRKPENLLERGNSDRDNSGGYDLTNPNLHHGAEDIYRTVQSSDQPGSNASNVAVAPSATIGESFESSGLQVGDSGPNATVIANQSAYEGQAFLLDISSHFVAPVAGDALTFSGSLPAGLHIDAHTGIISGVPTDGDFGYHPITVTATDAHGVAIIENLLIQIGDSGPTATTIADQTAHEGQPFSLDISGHFVASVAGDTLSFSGSLPTGLSIDARTGIISGVPTDNDFGHHPITVTATDTHGMAISETFLLQVDDSGPTATVVANQSAYEGEAFSLNVSGHFVAPVGGDTLTFSGSLPTGLSIDAHTGVISGVPTDSDYGNRTITVTATDAHGMAISETFHLQVGDKGPTATVIANQTAYEGQAYSLNVSSHFVAPAAGDALAFSGSMPTGLSLNANTGIVSGVPTDSDYGNRTITVTATDAHGKAISETFQLQVGDKGPTATVIANQTAYEGQAYSLNVSSHFVAPAAGDTLTFSGLLPAGLSINAHTGVISGVPTDGDFGNNAITVTATDAHGMAISETFLLQVGDKGPTATAIANQTAYEGQAYSLNVSSHFKAPAPGDALTFSGSLPAGLIINAHTGVISGVPTDGDYGNNAITVTATDAHGIAISETFHLQVGDKGPTATAIANQTAYEGQAYSLNVSSHFMAPAAGDTLTFSGSMPAGLSINAHTGVISGVPTDSDFGDRMITVKATDAHGKAISETFHLQVGDHGPTATAIANQSAYEGQAFSLNVASHFVAPAAGDTLTFSGSMPAGLSINAHTGVISGAPTDGDFGNNAITVTATDAHGMAISETFHLQVGDKGPTATVIANQSAYEGQAFSLNISSHFKAPATGDTLTFSGSLPAGLGIDAHTGIISGVPTDGDFGNNAITVTATDAHGMAISETFHLQIGDKGPTATVIANQSAYEGQAFSLDISSHFAAPAAGDALTFLGSLPTGLSIDAHTGIISGVPTDSDFGNHSIKVTATDAHGKAISESFQLQVGDSGPTAAAIANQTTTEGQAFSLNVSSHFVAPAAGDTLTFTASLPAGLSINAHTGIISGVPTDSDFTSSAHEYNFNFTSFDGHFTVTGQLITSQSLDAAGGFDVTGITGSVLGPNGAMIGGLVDNPSHSTGSISPDGVWIYDNILYAGGGTLVDYGGMLFTSNNYEYNIFYDASHYLLETLNPQGVLNPGEAGSFTISAVPADHPITVTATDAHGMAISETFNLQVGDNGPATTAIGDQTAYQDQTFSLDVSSHFVAPAAGDTLTFSGSLPTGLSIDAHTGVISGVPTQGDLGNNPITVTAIDAHGMAISESFHLEVGDTNHTFFINSHNGDASINGSSSWTDTVDLHNVGQNASFNIVELAADGHTVHSWTGLVASGSVVPEQTLTLTHGDHATITINHFDGSATDHIALQNIDHIRY
jgi:Putative Ig domain